MPRLAQTICLATMIAMTGGRASAAETTANEPPLRDRLGLPKAYRPIFSQRSELWANVAGGIERDLEYTGLMTFGAEIDLEAAEWLSGGSVGIVGLGLQGGNITPEAVGDAGIASNIAGVSTVRLFKVWYRQRLWDGDLDLKVGIIPLDDDFMFLDSAQLFTNSGFGTAQTEALNTPAPIYPLGALGTRVKAMVHDDWEVMVGLYDGDAGDPRRRTNASQLALTSDGGAIILGEVSWRTKPAGRPLRLTLGGFGDTGRFRDYESRHFERGLGSLYLMGEHAVARWASSTIWLFSHTALAFPNPRVVSDLYADAGLVVDGGAWARPRDRLGLGAAWTGFGRDQVRWRRAGAPGRAPLPTTAGEAVVELTYASELWPWLLLQPTAQFHRRPRAAPEDAWLLGMRATFRL